MGVSSIDWTGRFSDQKWLTVARGQGRSAEMLRALAKELAVQI